MKSHFMRHRAVRSHNKSAFDNRMFSRDRCSLGLARNNAMIASKSMSLLLLLLLSRNPMQVNDLFPVNASWRCPSNGRLAASRVVGTRRFSDRRDELPRRAVKKQWRASGFQDPGYKHKHLSFGRIVAKATD